ncbi:MAG: hypothetical protein IKJ87_04840 [Ruminococcus sp.]|nr:hypothetical protein [Ruminococcus sp.]
MKNNSTSLSQAFKLYTGVGLPKCIFQLSFLLIWFDAVLLFFMNLADDGDVSLPVRALSSIACFMFINLRIMGSYDIGYNAGKFFRTVKEPISIHAKYHIGTIIESVAMIMVNYLLMAIIYSEIWECIVMAVFMIVIKGLTNLLEFIRKPPFRVIGLCVLGIMMYIPYIVFLIMHRNGVDFQPEPWYIPVAVLAIAFLVLSEYIVLKNFRKNWYRD